MEARYKRLIKNTSLILFGGALTKIVSLLMLPFYTSWLSVSDYGATDIITVYATLLTGVSTLSVAEAMFIFPKGASVKEQKHYFSSAIAFTLMLLAGLAIIFSLVDFYGNRHQISNSFVTYIWLIYGIICSSFFQTLVQQFACAINAMKVYSFTGLVYATVLAGTAFCLIPQWGVNGYVYSMILSNLVASMYAVFFAKLYRYVSVQSISFASYKSMVKYSIPLIPNSLMFWLVSSFNRPFLESYVGMAGIGLFAVANKFSSVLSMVFQYFASSWQVSVCEEYGKEGFERFYNRVLRILYVTLISFATLITIFSKELLLIFSSQEYYSAAVFIAPLCLGVIFNCMSGLTGGIFAVVKKSRYFFYSSVWGAIASLICNVLFIPVLGIWGAILAIILSFFVMWITRSLYAKRFLSLQYSWIYIVLLGYFVLITLMAYFSHSTLTNCVGAVIFILIIMLNKSIRLQIYSVIKYLFKRVR
ncbi:hypothetical protein B5F34_06615 [Mediterranea sp. An20]|uniref:lipopolysaccharide biosynthesis protein n=1 Tax=Mediterranea sp. An20 TaxID=1965586 RepID=UPI000B392249|nr:polysaccharide biosynthesis C-terminal domain-containing protein [Mediterranea sp. An20]OUP09319.1 hypothetical protein B5F34_06615 [Mediterranea sp. An20]